MERDFSTVRRIVVKVGTNILSTQSTVDTGFISSISSQIKALLDRKLQVILVTSGAIGMGAGELGISIAVKEIDMRQACAAIGQPLLMHAYREAFRKEGVLIAQVLLTSEVLSNRHSFLNLRNSMETLLNLGVVPIINENDCVSTREIGNAFGDNDRLSAYIASKINADMLVMLTDIDAVYTKNPRKYDDAEPIYSVQEITREMEDAAGEQGSTFSTGGMKTKIAAVKIARKAGCHVVIAGGRQEAILEKILTGEQTGTHFIPGEKISGRRRWIQNCQVKGKIIVDDGAISALKLRKSLLPKGVIDVDGTFGEGDVVSVNDVFKVVTSFSSAELRKIIGMHSGEIRKILGQQKRDVIAVPEDIIEYTL